MCLPAPSRHLSAAIPTSAGLLLALVLLASPAAAQSFEPNHVFTAVHSEDVVREYDAEGVLVRSFDASLGVDNPYGLAFGPDGRLHVSCWGSQSILVIDGAGEVVDTLGQGILDRPDDMAFGPKGQLYVVDQGIQAIVEFDPEGTFVRTITMEGDVTFLFGGLAVGPDGHLFTGVMAGSFNGRIAELDPSGKLIRLFGGDLDLAQVGAIVLGPDGHLFVATYNPVSSAGRAVHEIDIEGNLVNTLITFQLVRALAMGPSGNLLAASNAPATVEEVARDGTVVREIGRASSGVAVSPWRYEVRVAGKTARRGLPVEKTRYDGVLTLAPGSKQMILSLGEGTEKEHFVFQGFEAYRDEDVATRRYQGTTLPRPANVEGTVTLNLLTKGTVSETTGFYRIKRARGRLHLASAAGVFTGRLKTRELLD